MCVHQLIPPNALERKRWATQGSQSLAHMEKVAIYLAAYSHTPATDVIVCGVKVGSCSWVRLVCACVCVCVSVIVCG